MKIHWNDFLKHSVENYPNESCGFLFSERPYSPTEEWHVFAVENISEKPKEAWKPDKKGMKKVKDLATKKQLVKIGNIHTHPHKEGMDIQEELKPSKKDLEFARRFNDIVRGIIVVDNKTIYGIRFHDKFGNRIEPR